jgi:XTP/dITP diphosphohydrolase
LKLLLASRNPKKRAELRAFLAELDVAILTPDEIGGLPEVVEDQPTFRANAAKKAISAAMFSGLWSLADDSGLEVDHLNGDPGVRSARWAGEPGDDDANNRMLVARMKDAPADARGARFVCALALARPDGSLAAEISGSACGRILNEPRGDRDFGYDPYFLFTESGHPQTGKGFAELSIEEKSAVSHRGRALRELARRLPAILRNA